MFKTLFTKSGFSFDRLKTLIEVVDAGSIAKAAKGDPTTQSLYSRQIKELEAFVGCKLTIRQGRTLQFNDDGKRLAELARTSLKSFDDFVNTTRKDIVTYHIASGEYHLHWLIIPKLGKLRSDFRKHTKTDVTFVCSNKRTSEIITGIANSTYDFGVINHGEDIRHPLTSAPLATIEYKLYVPNILLPKHTPAKPEHLLSTLPVAAQDPGSTHNKILESMLGKTNKTLQQRLVCSSLPQMLQAVKSGEYVGVLPSSVRSDLPSSGFTEISFSKTNETSMRQTTHLVWNPRTEQTRDHMFKLRELMTEAFD